MFEVLGLLAIFITIIFYIGIFIGIIALAIWLFVKLIRYIIQNH